MQLTFSILRYNVFESDVYSVICRHHMHTDITPSSLKLNCFYNFIQPVAVWHEQDAQSCYTLIAGQQHLFRTCHKLVIVLNTQTDTTNVMSQELHCSCAHRSSRGSNLAHIFLIISKSGSQPVSDSFSIYKNYSLQTQK